MFYVLLLAVLIILPSDHYKMANNDIYIKNIYLFLFVFNFLALLKSFMKCLWWGESNPRSGFNCPFTQTFHA